MFLCAYLCSSNPFLYAVFTVSPFRTGPPQLNLSFLMTHLRAESNPFADATDRCHVFSYRASHGHEPVHVLLDGMRIAADLWLTGFFTCFYIGFVQSVCSLYPLHICLMGFDKANSIVA